MSGSGARPADSQFRARGDDEPLQMRASMRQQPFLFSDTETPVPLCVLPAFQYMRVRRRITRQIAFLRRPTKRRFHHLDVLIDRGLGEALRAERPKKCLDVVFGERRQRSSAIRLDTILSGERAELIKAALMIHAYRLAQAFGVDAAEPLERDCCWRIGYCRRRSLGAKSSATDGDAPRIRECLRLGFDSMRLPASLSIENR
jgi:hypothetical protein